MKKVVISLLLSSFTLSLTTVHKNSKSSREIINELELNTQLMNKLVLSIPRVSQLITRATKIDNTIKDLEKKVGITELKHKRARIMRKIYETRDDNEQGRLKFYELEPISKILSLAHDSLRRNGQFIKLYNERKSVTEDLNRRCKTPTVRQLNKYSSRDIELSSELCTFTNSTKLLQTAQEINNKNLFYKYFNFYSIEE